MRVTILLVFVLGSHVAADLIHEAVNEMQPITLSCPEPVDDEVTWSVERNGRKDDILTIVGDSITKHIKGPYKHYNTQHDKSLYILRVNVSDSGKYFCNNKPAVRLTVIPSGTVTQTVKEGKKKATLNCTSHVEGPEPSWRREIAGKPEQIRAPVPAVGKKLKITEVQFNDFGLYFCDGKPAVYLDVTKNERNNKASTSFLFLTKTTDLSRTFVKHTCSSCKSAVAMFFQSVGVKYKGGKIQGNGSMINHNGSTLTPTMKTTNRLSIAQATTQRPSTTTSTTTRTNNAMTSTVMTRKSTPAMTSSVITTKPNTTPISAVTATTHKTTITIFSSPEEYWFYGLGGGVALIFLIATIVCITWRCRSKKKETYGQFHVYDEVATELQPTNGLPSSQIRTICYKAGFPDDHTYSTIPDLLCKNTTESPYSLAGPAVFSDNKIHHSCRTILVGKTQSTRRTNMKICFCKMFVQIYLMEYFVCI